MDGSVTGVNLIAAAEKKKKECDDPNLIMQRMKTITHEFYSIFLKKAYEI